MRAGEGVTLPLSLVFGAPAAPALSIQPEGDVPQTVPPPAAAGTAGDIPPGDIHELTIGPRGVLGAEFDAREFARVLRYAGGYSLVWRPFGASGPVARQQIRIEGFKDAIIVTDFGKITVELAYDTAPANVENFLELARTDFYHNLNFHRIVPDYVLSGGCPVGDGSGQRRDGKLIPAELTEETFDVGTVAMSHLPDDVNSGSCQLFICLAAAPELQGRYTVLGRARDSRSLQTLRAISDIAIDRNYRPLRTVFIRSVNLVDRDPRSAPSTGEPIALPQSRRATIPESTRRSLRSTDPSPQARNLQRRAEPDVSEDGPFPTPSFRSESPDTSQSNPRALLDNTEQNRRSPARLQPSAPRSERSARPRDLSAPPADISASSKNGAANAAPTARQSPVIPEMRPVTPPLSRTPPPRPRLSDPPPSPIQAKTTPPAQKNAARNAAPAVTDAQPAPAPRTVQSPDVDAAITSRPSASPARPEASAPRPIPAPPMRAVSTQPANRARSSAAINAPPATQPANDPARSKPASSRPAAARTSSPAPTARAANANPASRAVQTKATQSPAPQPAATQPARATAPSASTRDHAPSVISTAVREPGPLATGFRARRDDLEASPPAAAAETTRPALSSGAATSMIRMIPMTPASAAARPTAAGARAIPPALEGPPSALRTVRSVARSMNSEDTRLPTTSGGVQALPGAQPPARWREGSELRPAAATPPRAGTLGRAPSIARALTPTSKPVEPVSSTTPQIVNLPPVTTRPAFPVVRMPPISKTSARPALALAPLTPAAAQAQFRANRAPILASSRLSGTQSLAMRSPALPMPLPLPAPAPAPTSRPAENLPAMLPLGPPPPPNPVEIPPRRVSMASHPRTPPLPGGDHRAATRTRDMTPIKSRPSSR